jgi:hypothetical protein
MEDAVSELKEIPPTVGAILVDGGRRTATSRDEVSRTPYSRLSSSLCPSSACLVYGVPADRGHLRRTEIGRPWVKVQYPP